MLDPFELVREAMTIAHVNLRTEKHGDDDVPAMDIKLEAPLHNSVLSKFSPELKASLYTQDPGATQDMINPDHAPHLINPRLCMPLKWDFDLPSVKFEIHDDNDLGHIVFPGAKAGKFSFDCKEGGTVNLSFRIQISEPDETEAATVFMLLNKRVKISLTQEAVQEQDPAEPTSEGGETGDNVHPLFPLNGQADESLLEVDPVVAAITESAKSDADELLYDNVVAYTQDQDKVSISIIKREFKLEVLPATRIIERMEAEEVIGAANGHGMHSVNKEAA